MRRRALPVLLLPLLVLPLTGPVAAAQSGPSLVVDAGASSAVTQGDHAVVLGSAYGGTEPHTYTWSTSAGTVESPANAATGIDTTDVPAGQITATLTVTDADGATATDTVRLLVVGGAADDDGAGAGSGERVDLLDETVADPTPGATEVFSFPFDVPAGLDRIVVQVTWDNVLNDYDLVVNDPDGAEAGSSGNFAQFEEAAVGTPAAGTWEAVVNEYASSGAENLHVVAFGEKSAEQSLEESGDAGLPLVDAGGPYEFTIGETQTLLGTVEGGQAPLQVGWDLDRDGTIDADGSQATTTLGRGHHLVRFLATDGRGFEAQQMTSVIVGTEAEIDSLQVPVTVIAMSDSGINPYHEAFSAATYPDPEVLRLTQGFTRHPSEYLPGYPTTSVAAPITTNGGYYPEDDMWIFHREILEEPIPDCADLGIVAEATMSEAHIAPGQMYWFPGTKIIGAVSSNGYGPDDCPDPDLILDNDGHGTGSASVATGNRYGYCPTCLIVMVEGLTEEVVFQQFPFAPITSHSHGYVGGLPIGYANKAFELLGGETVGSVSKAAVESGQTVLFAAGNGVGNAFDVPQRTYDSDQTGPAWPLVVGALRRDDQGAITGDGIPQHISSWGDGNLPSACRTGVHGQCAFGGTSAATPYTAGTLGTVLTAVKDALGDGTPGLRAGQVVAQGTPIAGSPWLDDGVLTRNELRTVFLKTAEYLNVTAEPNGYAFPDSYNAEQGRYAHEGYGMAGPYHATRAIAVLLGERELPDRSEADEFFAQDCEIREGLYGGYDRDGDGETDDCSLEPANVADGTGERTSAPHDPDLFEDARGVVARDPVLAESIEYVLHRQYRTEPYRTAPACGVPQTATEDDMEQFMDRDLSELDVDPCWDSRITSTVAAFRPKGIYTATDVLEGTLPTGSEVAITLYAQTVSAGAGQWAGRLMASDRVIGESADVTAVTSPGGWTQIPIVFNTERPAFRGEHLTVQFRLAGHAEWAYGHTQDHSSRVKITPGPAPEAGDEFAVTIARPPSARTAVTADGLDLAGLVGLPDPGLDTDLHNAGFRPVRTRVQIAVDDPTFADPHYADVDEAAGTWSATIDDPGPDATVYARVLRDRTPSAVATLSLSDAPAPAPATSDPAAAPAPAGPTTSPQAGNGQPTPTTGGGLALVGLLLAGTALALRRRTG